MFLCQLIDAKTAVEHRGFVGHGPVGRIIKDGVVEEICLRVVGANDQNSCGKDRDRSPIKNSNLSPSGKGFQPGPGESSCESTVQQKKFC